MTPAVTGTLMMLISAEVLPVVFKLIEQDGVSTGDSLLSALTTLSLISMLSLYGTRVLRIWAPAMGIIAGCVVAYIQGFLDFTPVFMAHWSEFLLLDGPRQTFLLV